MEQTTLDTDDNSVTLLIDPTSEEYKHEQSQGLLSIACLPAMGTVTNLSFQGDLSRDAVKQVRPCTLLEAKARAETSSTGSRAAQDQVQRYPRRSRQGSVRQRSESRS